MFLPEKLLFQNKISLFFQFQSCRGNGIYGLLIVLAIFTLSMIPAFTMLGARERLEKNTSEIIDASLIASSLLEDVLFFGIENRRPGFPGAALGQEISVLDAVKAFSCLSPGQRQRYSRYSCTLLVRDALSNSRLKSITVSVFWNDNISKKEYSISTLALLDENGRVVR